MKVSKLIFTKRGYHFREVKHLRPVGIFQVVTDEGVYIFCDKREISMVSELFEYIEKKRKQWKRDKKLENLLD